MRSKVLQLHNGPICKFSRLVRIIWRRIRTMFSRIALFVCGTLEWEESLFYLRSNRRAEIKINSNNSLVTGVPQKGFSESNYKLLSNASLTRKLLVFMCLELTHAYRQVMMCGWVWLHAVYVRRLPLFCVNFPKLPAYSIYNGVVHVSKYPCVGVVSNQYFMSSVKLAKMTTIFTSEK